MEDELELDLGNEEINRNNSRIKSLADKVKTTSEERDALAKEKEELAQARASAEKERDFFKGFTPVSAKYPGSANHQDKIWDKVKLGLDVEEATMLVMAKEAQNTPPPTQDLAAGGSASIGMNDTSDKPLASMSRQEMKDTLLDLERKGEFNFFKQN